MNVMGDMDRYRSISTSAAFYAIDIDIDIDIVRSSSGGSVPDRPVD